ncbi:MAG: diguanylate cyclase [Bacillota bacterium]
MKNIVDLKNSSKNPDIIIAMDEKGNYKNIWTNKPEDLVAPIKELKDKNVEEILPLIIAKNYKRYINLAIESKEIQKYQYKLKLKKGINFFETLFIAIDNNKVLAFINNITDRKNIKDKLRKTESRYHTLFENFPAVIWEEDFSEIKKYVDSLKNKNVNLSKYLDENPDEVEKVLTMINVIDVNKTSLKFYNADSKEEIYNNFDKLFTKKGKEVFKEIIVAIAKEERKFRSDSVTKTLDGKRKDIRIEWKIAEDDINYSRVYLSIFDVSERKLAEKVIKRQHAYFQQLFDNSPEGIVLLDNREQVIKINDSFEKIFGYSQSEIEGRKINNLIIPEEKRSEGSQISQDVKEGATVEKESIRQTKIGEKINVSIKGYPIIYEGQKLGVYAIYSDISDRKREEEKNIYLSFHDQLTDLYNRRYFEEELVRLNKSRNLPISIIVADMDGLKKINDKFGHKEGDRYIKMIAEIINSSVREADIVARIGGDEFAILLPEADIRIAKNIEKRISKKCKEKSQSLKVPIRISTGSASKNSIDKNLDEIFKTADSKMYDMKESKK